MRKVLSCALALALGMTLLFPVTSFAKAPKLITDLGGDIRETFTGVPLLLLIGGATAAGETYAVDADIQSHFQQPHLGKFDKVGDILGSAYLVDGSAVVVYGIGAIAKLPEVKNTGEALVEALFLTEATTAALKFAWHRDRPNGGRWSFPSAHASRCFAAAAVLTRLHGVAAGIPAYLAATAVALTRLDSNVHWTSDLIFGAALGSAIGFGTAKIHLLQDKDVMILPTGSGLLASFAF